MSEQYLRVCRLSAGGTSLNLDDLQVEFFIRQQTIQTPNTAEIRIFNLSEATKALLCRESQTVILEAGYRGGFGPVFKGEVQHANRGRANPTDTIIDLYCGDGDLAYLKGRVSKTLKAGATRRDVVEECLKAFKPYGISGGFMSPKLSGQKFPKPFVMFGMAREYMRKMARDLNADWSFQSQRLNFLTKSEALPGGEVVLNSATGMIGRATQSFNGITVRTLINPAMSCDRVVRIDEKSIDRAAPALGIGGYDQAQNDKLPSIAADGRYRVFGLDRVGNLRGTEWYDVLHCASASADGTYLPKALMGMNA